MMDDFESHLMRTREVKYMTIPLRELKRSLYRRPDRWYVFAERCFDQVAESKQISSGRMPMKRMPLIHVVVRNEPRLVKVRTTEENSVDFIADVRSQGTYR